MLAESIQGADTRAVGEHVGGALLVAPRRTALASWGRLARPFGCLAGDGEPRGGGAVKAAAVRAAAVGASGSVRFCRDVMTARAPPP